jgi:hypothetical protein
MKAIFKACLYAYGNRNISSSIENTNSRHCCITII